MDWSALWVEEENKAYIETSRRTFRSSARMNSSLSGFEVNGLTSSIEPVGWLVWKPTLELDDLGGREILTMPLVLDFYL